MEFGREDQTPVEQAGQLARLTDLDYEMEEGQPDVIGWKVMDDKGSEVATVEDLLVDIDSGAIMLAVISFENRQTLVPIEAFALDASNNKLILPVDKSELMDAPAFTDKTDDVGAFFDYWGGYEEEEFEEQRREMS